MNLILQPEFGQTQILNDISLDIFKTEILGLVGPSGSGKSIFLKTLLGLNYQLPDFELNGKINVHLGNETLNAHNTQELELLRCQKIGIIWQQSAAVFNPSQKLGYQILEKLKLSSDISKEQQISKVESIIEQVGLIPAPRFFESYAHQLSGGQIQRMIIALALINDPILLLADEPFSSIDEPLRIELQDLFKKLNKQGLTILIASHNIKLIDSLCDRCYKMDRGKLSLIDGPLLEETKEITNNKLSNNISKNIPLFELKNITKSYPKTNHIFRKNQDALNVFENFDLTIYKGEILGITGSSGAGKSTLGRILVNSIDIEKGEILYRGTSLSALTKAEYRSFLRRNQMIYQDPLTALTPHLTIRKTLKEAYSTVSRDEDSEFLESTLDMVSLDHSILDRLPYQLSGGQRQRVMIARAVILKADFIVCDEILASLDHKVSLSILKLLKDLNLHQNMTILFISHNTKLVESIAHRVLIISD